MNSSRFEKKQLQYVASLLKCKIENVIEIAKQIDANYAEYETNKVDKNTGVAKLYKDGTPKKRKVSPPSPLLKKFQRLVKINVLDNFAFPSHVQGAVKGKSNISNAKAHQGKKYKFSTDLQDFFPSVSNKAVYKVFLGLGYTNHIARWLTRICTLNFCLPQGAPTSAHLANLAFLETDKVLLEFCEARRITYTRFIDDLTFSSAIDFKDEIPGIVEIIRSSGFRINHRKTNYNVNQIITGIAVFNNFIDAPSHIKEKARLEDNNEGNMKPFKNYLNQIEKANRDGKTR